MFYVLTCIYNESVFLVYKTWKVRTKAFASNHNSEIYNQMTWFNCSDCFEGYARESFTSGRELRPSVERIGGWACAQYYTSPTPKPVSCWVLLVQFVLQSRPARISKTNRGKKLSLSRVDVPKRFSAPKRFSVPPKSLKDSLEL